MTTTRYGDVGDCKMKETTRESGNLIRRVIKRIRKEKTRNQSKTGRVLVITLSREKEDEGNNF